MRKITARIVRFFIESKVIDETDQEIYEYGLEILIENVMLTVFLLLFGVMIGKGIETCIFLFSFCWLRRFCGGYHAKMLIYGKEATTQIENSVPYYSVSSGAVTRKCCCSIFMPLK